MEYIHINKYVDGKHMHYNEYTDEWELTRMYAEEFVISPKTAYILHPNKTLMYMKYIV